MNKFCGNCGSRLDDDARVCGNCGTPVDNNGSFTYQKKVVDPAKKRKMVKRIKGLMILFVIVAVIVTGVRVGLSFTGTRGLVRKVVNAYEDYDISALVALSSEMYYYNDDADYVNEYFENIVGSAIDTFETNVGHDYRLSYDIYEIYEVSERRKEDYFNSIESMYPNFDVSTIDEISVATVNITAKQKERSYNQNMSLVMSKEGKNWKILYIQ